MSYRFNIGDGIRHPQYGVGLIQSTLVSYKADTKGFKPDPTNRYMAMFDETNEVHIVLETDLESVPSRGIYRGGQSS